MIVLSILNTNTASSIVEYENIVLSAGESSLRKKCTRANDSVDPGSEYEYDFHSSTRRTIDEFDWRLPILIVVLLGALFV